jgi:cytochrome c oxidase assembly protein subunit 15
VRRHLPVVSPKAFRWLAFGVLLSIVALIGTGEWVRLSESGLGCPTWPYCTANDIAATLHYHAMVEFTNRCIITLVGIGVGLTFLATFLLPERRRDLRWLAGALIAGYVGEAVLGGITVLEKLNPALVAGHLILAFLLVADAVVLHWRAGRAPGKALAHNSPETLWLVRLMLLALAVIVMAGTVATGSGPKAGQPGTPRFPFPFPAAVEFHAICGMFLFGATVAAFFAIRAAKLPYEVRRSHLALLGALCLQGVLGYSTYFTGVEIFLADFHAVEAAVVAILLVRFYLHLRDRRPALSLVRGDVAPSVAGAGRRSAAGR